MRRDTLIDGTPVDALFENWIVKQRIEDVVNRVLGEIQYTFGASGVRQLDKHFREDLADLCKVLVTVGANEAQNIRVQADIARSNQTLGMMFKAILEPVTDPKDTALLVGAAVAGSTSEQIEQMAQSLRDSNERRHMEND